MATASPSAVTPCRHRVSIAVAVATALEGATIDHPDVASDVVPLRLTVVAVVSTIADALIVTRG